MITGEDYRLIKTFNHIFALFTPYCHDHEIVHDL